MTRPVVVCRHCEQSQAAEGHFTSSSPGDNKPAILRNKTLENVIRTPDVQEEASNSEGNVADLNPCHAGYILYKVKEKYPACKSMGNTFA